MKTPPSPIDAGSLPVPFPRHVAVIGLGLLGGSVARAIRERYPDVRLTACVRSVDNRRFAIEQGIVDEATGDPLTASAGADLVVIATPVDKIASIAIAIHSSNPGATLTDLGSTKATIIAAIERCPAVAACFVGAHPIAGGEKTGVQHSRGDLFVNRPIVLTLSGRETEFHASRAEAFWASTGGTIFHLTAEQHDHQLAATSHVPHLVAALTARLVPDEAMPLVGAGWCDTTRIAAGDPSMWTAIVNENRAAILNRLRQTQHDLDSLISTIQSQDNATLQEWLQIAQAKRLSKPFS